MTYVPLSRRPPEELRAQGEGYGRMAQTARTAAAKSALDALAIRFAALATRLEAKAAPAGAAQRAAPAGAESG